MESMTLSDEEIRGLKLFMDEVKKIPLVECVYILPHYSELRQAERVSVVSVVNKDRLNGQDIREEKENLDILMHSCNSEYKEARLVFRNTFMKDYSLALKSINEKTTEMELVTGTILFDRFGVMFDNKRQASRVVDKYPNVLTIDNFEELMSALSRGEEFRL